MSTHLSDDGMSPLGKELFRIGIMLSKALTRYPADCSLPDDWSERRRVPRLRFGDRTILSLSPR